MHFRHHYKSQLENDHEAHENNKAYKVMKADVRKILDLYPRCNGYKRVLQCLKSSNPLSNNPYCRRIYELCRAYSICKPEVKAFLKKECDTYDGSKLKRRLSRDLRKTKLYALV